MPSDQLSVPNINQLKQQVRDSNFSDDEPLYDAVASDEDYAPLNPVPQKVRNRMLNLASCLYIKMYKKENKTFLTKNNQKNEMNCLLLKCAILDRIRQNNFKN